MRFRQTLDTLKETGALDINASLSSNHSEITQRHECKPVRYDATNILQNGQKRRNKANANRLDKTQQKECKLVRIETTKQAPRYFRGYVHTVSRQNQTVSKTSPGRLSARDSMLADLCFHYGPKTGIAVLVDAHTSFCLIICRKPRKRPTSYQFSLLCWN